MSEDEVRGLHAAEPREVLGVSASPHRPDARGFTPGPWGWPHLDVLAANTQNLDPDMDWFEVAQFTRRPSAEDARLIAAAPDLYAAVSEVLDWLHGVMPDGTPVGDDKAGATHMYETVRAALARANGEAIPSTPSTSSPRTAKQTQKDA